MFLRLEAKQFLGGVLLPWAYIFDLSQFAERSPCKEAQLQRIAQPRIIEPPPRNTAHQVARRIGEIKRLKISETPPSTGVVGSQ